MRDNIANQVVALDYGTTSRDADTTLASKDRKGYDSLSFHIGVGIGGITFDGTNYINLVMEESDNNSDWTAVADGEAGTTTVATGGIVKRFIAEHAAAATYAFAYTGSKRYVRMRADFEGTHGAATPLSAVTVLGHPYVAPATSPV